MCTHRLADTPDSLPCDNPAPHPGDGHGCTYTASAGCDLARTEVAES